MTSVDRFEATIAEWLDAESAYHLPDHLGEVVAQTAVTSQRAAWSSPERWLPVQLTYSARLVRTDRMPAILAIVAMAILITTALLLAGTGQRRVPHFGSEANGLLAFVDGTSLKVADANGSNIRVGATLPQAIESLTYSPDGMRLAYRTASTPSSIVVAMSDGSQPTVVSGPVAVAGAAQNATRGPFAWSPDSRRLAFTAALADGRREIDVVDADGSHLAPLVPNPPGPAMDWFDPVWSPDGQWISLFSTAAPDSIAITVIHPDGTGARVLPTSPVNPSFLEMAWSPDPDVQRLEYAAGEDVMIFDLESATETRVATGFWGSWSPDGRSIAWWDAKPGDLASPIAGGTRVATVEDVLAGTDAPVTLWPRLNNYACHRSTAEIGICSPAEWSPDSKWVFGPDPTGRSIVLATVAEPRTVRTIKLDQRADLSNGPLGSLAWQPVAP